MNQGYVKVIGVKSPCGHEKWEKEHLEGHYFKVLHKDRFTIMIDSKELDLSDIPEEARKIYEETTALSKDEVKFISKLEYKMLREEDMNE